MNTLMKRRLSCAPFILLVLFLGFSPAVSAQKSAEDTLKELYSSRIREAKRDRDGKASVSLAKELINDADGLHADPPLRRLLYFEAYDLAMTHPMKHEGYAIAIKSMDHLQRAEPLMKLVCQEKRVDVWMRLLRMRMNRSSKAKVAAKAASDLLFLISMAVEQGQIDKAANLSRQGVRLSTTAKSEKAQEVYKKLTNILSDQRKAKSREKELRKEILENPDKSEAQIKEMVILLLVELNDANRALRYSTFSGDNELMKIADYATRNPNSIKSKHALALAEWYEKQMENASDAGEIICAARAITYFEIAASAEKDGTVAALKLEKKADALRNMLAETHDYARRVVMGTPLPTKK